MEWTFSEMEDEDFFSLGQGGLEEQLVGQVDDHTLHRDAMEEIVQESSNYLMFDSQLYAGVNNPTTPVPARRNSFDELPIMSGMLTRIDMF